jgi:hypothetical protein
MISARDVVLFAAHLCCCCGSKDRDDLCGRKKNLFISLFLIKNFCLLHIQRSAAEMISVISSLLQISGCAEIISGKDIFCLCTEMRSSLVVLF